MSGVGLGEQQDWLRAVLDLLPFPAQLIEPGTGRLLFANEAARHLPLPSSHEDPPSEEIYLTDPGGARIPPDRWPDRRAARGEPLDGPHVTWHAPGRRATFSVSSGAVPAMRGQPPLVLLTYLDVTRLKATEEELREAVRVRDEFFSFATHELKDPLNTLLLSVEVLKRMAERRGAVPPEVLAERLEVIKRQGGHLARMIGNLLDVSRIANGRLQLNVEAFDLRDLVLEVVGRFRDPAREAGVDLAVEPSGPIIGYYDRVQLEHAVGNLVSNALKYGEGKPVSIRVGGDEATATLEVEDRGIGVAEADHARIFERFERAAVGHSEKSLGLGLYIVRSVVEAHGGTIGLRSRPGCGTTFTVALPRRRMPGAGLPADASGGTTDTPGAGR